MTNSDDTFNTAPSKSQRKRDMTALQDIGEKLAALSAPALRKCELPERLLVAVEEFRRLPNKHGARRRQLQYIGKLMRDLSERNLALIQAQTEVDHNRERQHFMALESLRNRLLDADSSAFEELLRAHPDIDLLQLRQLSMQARQERDQGSTPPLASRRLFQFLRQIHERPSGDDQD